MNLVKTRPVPFGFLRHAAEGPIKTPVLSPETRQ